MSLEVGDALLGTGLAGAIMAEFVKLWPKDKKTDMANLPNAIAKAVVEYIVANAVVSVAEAPGGTPLTPPGIGSLS